MQNLFLPFVQPWCLGVVSPARGRTKMMGFTHLPLKFWVAIHSCAPFAVDENATSNGSACSWVIKSAGK